MKPELEDLLQAYNAFKQAPEGPDAVRLHDAYEAKLAEASLTTKTNRETLHHAVSRFHPRWGARQLAAWLPQETGT